MKRIVAALALLATAACGGDPKSEATAPAATPTEAEVSVIGANEIAERFVKLSLALGRHDADYVDAFSGPPEWSAEAEATPQTLDALAAEASDLIEAIDVLTRDGADPREAGLKRLVTAAATRIKMAKGERFSFNEEARLLYGVTPPDYSLAEFDSALADLDRLLPGEGALGERYKAFKNAVAIPKDKLQAVFDAAIAECRKRTLARYDLPEGENFAMQFVTGKPWSGYNWYKGDFKSVIEINTDLPIYIDRAVDLGCHEGYPGHHVWNVVVDRDLRRDAGWIEYSVLPLFSPQAVIGEGSANYGIDLAFPGAEKLAFERDVLFPLAGLDPSRAEKLAAINEVRRRLSHVQTMAARDYLDGRIDRAATAALLEKYALETSEAAKKRVDFFDRYRAYVVNYSLGRDLVAAYVGEKSAQGEDPWASFETLLKSPDAAGALGAR
jgi:hypothetical protein